MSSMVSHPLHYNKGKIEVIEVIEFIEDQGLSYHRGSVIKYVCRAGHKDPGKEIEDLEKAAWYLRREIARKVAAKTGGKLPRPNDMNPKERKRG